MSPDPDLIRLLEKSFPRLRGDEPYLNPFVALQNAFSPPTRG